MSKNSHPQVISLITSHMYSARNCFIIFRLNIEFPSPVLSISHLGQTNRTSSILSHPVKSRRRRSSWVLSDNEYPFAKELLRGSFWSTSSRFDPHVHPFIQFATRLRGEHIVVVFSLLGQSFFFAPTGILQTLPLPRQLVQDNFKPVLSKVELFEWLK